MAAESSSPAALLSWRHLGSIDNFLYSDHGGVYCLVHHGKYNRVIYVGTTSHFGRRLQQHQDGFKRGNRTVWRIHDSDDVYGLMSSVGIRNYVNYFKKQAQQGNIWASTTLEKLVPKNLLLPSDDFEKWRVYVEQEYMPRIAVWALSLSPYKPETAAKIESALQQRIDSAFRLGRFFNHKDYTILGKIEFNKWRVCIKEVFDNTPDVDEATTLIFSSLAQKNNPVELIEIASEQLRPVEQARLAERADRRKRMKRIYEKNPNQGETWTRCDLEKLRLMLCDYNLKPIEISIELGRNTNAIQKKIKDNDRLTGGRWRKSVEELC